MNYLVFIFSFYVFSTLGLIVDVFFPEMRANKLTIEQIQNEYKHVYWTVSSNLTFLSLPIFSIVSLFYEESELSLYKFVLQIISTVFIGLALNEITILVNELQNMKKYRLQCKNKFGLMTFYEHPIVCMVNMSTFIFPITLGYYTSICKSWITIWMFKKVIFDNSDIRNLLYYRKLFNKTIKEYLYFTNILDTSEEAEAEAGAEAGAGVEEKENSNEETIEAKNISYFNSLCKANENTKLKFRNVMGRLHYSNFV